MEENSPFHYILKGAAPHVGLVLHRLWLRTTENSVEDVSSSAVALCLKATKLLLAFHGLSPASHSALISLLWQRPFSLSFHCYTGEGVLGLVVASLVAQMGKGMTEGGRAILDLLTQLGGADPTGFKAVVGNLPPQQALMLHSTARSAALSPASPAHPILTSQKTPQLDFSRYY